MNLTAKLMDDAYTGGSDKRYADKEFLQGIFDKLQLLPPRVAAKFSEQGRWADAHAMIQVSIATSEHIAILLKLSTIIDQLDEIKSKSQGDDVQTISDLLKMAQPPKKGATGGKVN
jgi:hypothetical protein